MHAASQGIAARRTTDSWYEAHPKSSFALTASALCVASPVGARAGMREFMYYFLLMAPWARLLTGSLVDTQPRDDARAPVGLLRQDDGWLCYE